MDFTILKTLRKSKKIKLSELSQSIGITSAYLSLIERNKKNPAISIIENLCKQLNCELQIKFNT